MIAKKRGKCLNNYYNIKQVVPLSPLNAHLSLKEFSIFAGSVGGEDTLKHTSSRKLKEEKEN